MSKTNLPAVQAGEHLNEDTASTDPDAGVPIGDEDPEVDELRPFALEELVVGHQSREGSGDAAMWRSNSPRLRIEFGRLQVVDNDLETWGHGKVIALDDASDAPICVYIDEMLLARGELVSQNKMIGVRITELIENDVWKAA
jgi:flagellar motor switch/type III secretory pathway protein FliN